jgi:hypothetical protein
MTTNEKSTAILKAILDICNKSLEEDPTADPMGRVVSLGPDWGGNALTIYVSNSHTHVGTPGGTFEQLVDQLHELLIEGRGLSWASPATVS